MQKSTSYKFQVYSYLFTLAMVLYHAQWNYLSDTSLVEQIYRPVTSIIDNLGGVAMAYFFMTSGFMLYYNANSDNVKEKVVRRVKTLIIPFCVWNMVYMPLKVIVLHESVGGILDVVYHFSFAPYAGPLWYVFAVFILSLFSPLIIRCKTFSNRSIDIILVVLCIVSLLMYGFGILSRFGLSEDTHFVMWSVRLWRYMPAYLLGSYVGLYRRNAYVELGSQKKTILTVIIILLLVLWMTVELPDYLKQILITVEPIILWIIVSDSLFENQERQYKFIRNAFLMYSTHFLIIYAIRTIVVYFIKTPIDGVLALIIWAIVPVIIIVATIVFSNMLVLFLKKVKQEKILYLLTGGRY